MADGSVLIDAKLNTSPVEKGLKALKGMFSGSGIAKAGQAAFTGITTAITATGVALTAMGGFAVNTGMKFDTAMSQVAATMRKSVDEIGGMREAAIKYGAETAFSATEAAEALNYLALAGYDAEKAVDVLPSVLDLAAAGNMDLAYASDLATDAMAALGIEANQENLTEFGDKMAKTASTANTSVAQLGKAILTIGGTAKILAGGTNELNTALGVLANRGYKGSEGGTMLRNVIASLTAPTDIARKAMKKLGIQVADSSGKMRPINNIMADFNKNTANMSDIARREYLSKIFNKEDLSAVEALLAGCGEEWDLLYEAIENADGAMSDMAKTQLDNLGGDVENLTGALESLGIAASDEVKDTLREIVQLGEAMVVRLTEAMSTGGFTAFASELGSVLADGLVAISSYIPRLVVMGSRVIKSLALGITQNADQIGEVAIEALGAIAVAVVGLLPELTVAAASLILSLAERIPTLLKLIVGAVKDIDWAQTGKDVLKLIVDTFSGWTDTDGNIATFAKTILSALTTDITGNESGDVASAFGTLISGISQEDISAAANSLAKVIFDAIVAGIGAITSGAASLAGAIGGFLGSLNEADFGTSIGTAATTVMDAIFDGIADVTTTPDMSALVSNIGKGIEESISFLGDIAGSIVGYILSEEGTASIIAAGTGIAGALGQGIGLGIYGLAEGIFNSLKSIFNASLTSVMRWFGIETDFYWQQIGDSMFTNASGAVMSGAELETKYLKEQMGTILDQVNAYLALKAFDTGNVLSQYSSHFSEAGIALVQALQSGMLSESDQITAMAALITNGMDDGLAELYPELHAQGYKAVEQFEEGFGNGTESLIALCDALGIEVSDTLADSLGDTDTWQAAVDDGLEEVKESIKQQSEELGGLAAQALEGADKTATEVSESVSESATTATTAAEEIASAAESAAQAETAVTTAQETISTATTTMETDAAVALETMNLTVEEIKTTVSALMTSLTEAINAGTEALSLAASGAGNAVLVGFQTELGIEDEESTVFADMGGNMVKSLASGISESATMTAFSTSANGVYTAVKSALDIAVGANGSKFKTIGLNICKGVAAGIEEGKSSVIRAAVSMAAEAYRAACDELGINSPSRKFAEIGMYCAVGMANGLIDNADAFVGAYRGMIDSARSYIVSSDLFGAAAERMHMAVEARTRYAIDATGFADAHFIDYQELAHAIWEEAPEELGITQTINFYEPVQTPDETARAIRYNNTQGLVGGKR